MNNIYPSLISSDLLHIGKTIEALEDYSAGFHLDVMDFHFVPNLTWGPDFINSIRKASRIKLQIHLMVDYPEKYFDRIFLNSGDIISVHPESPSTLTFSSLLRKIKEYGWTPSIALNPNLALDVISTPDMPIEHILFMSVFPGFSGQSFLPSSIDRLKDLSLLRSQLQQNFTIAVDGGITPELAKVLLQNGANELVIASSIFNNPDPVRELKLFSHINP